MYGGFVRGQEFQFFGRNIGNEGIKPAHHADGDGGENEQAEGYNAHLDDVGEAYGPKPAKNCIGADYGHGHHNPHFKAVAHKGLAHFGECNYLHRNPHGEGDAHEQGGHKPGFVAIAAVIEVAKGKQLELPELAHVEKARENKAAGRSEADQDAVHGGGIPNAAGVEGAGHAYYDRAAQPAGSERARIEHNAK